MLREKMPAAATLSRRSGGVGDSQHEPCRSAPMRRGSVSVKLLLRVVLVLAPAFRLSLPSEVSLPPLPGGDWLGSGEGFLGDASLIWGMDEDLPEVAADELEAGGVCDCWNTTEDGRHVEIECRCGGSEMMDIPPDLALGVHRITVVHAGMQVLKEGTLQPYKDSLHEIVLNNVRQLWNIHSRAFHGLEKLRTIYINHAPVLRHLADDLFSRYLPNLRILRIVHTGLQDIPVLHGLRTNSILHMVDLDNNLISRVPVASVRVRSEQFLMNYNAIEEVQDEAFNGSEIAKLSFKGNRQLRTIGPRAFVGLRSLRILDLSETAISSMPTLGLRELEILRVQDTDTLKVIPSIFNFENLREAWLTYPYHCCAFQFPAAHDPEEFARHQKWRAEVHSIYCQQQVRLRRSQQEFGRVVFSPDNLTSSARRHLPLPEPDWGLLAGVFHQGSVPVTPRLAPRPSCGGGNVSLRRRGEVRCLPAPDAFSPCEDLLGNWALRGAAWAVGLVALLGNLAVLAVLLAARFRLSVPKLLMCNLALADLCMGLYLLMLAAVDARSLGQYFNFAIDWQKGAGCQVAGFLTVFASELSVYTLTVITGERWYAITHALHLDRRLRLGTAGRIMAAGWIYAVSMASLPLLGVSGYSRTSICLPMENRDAADTAYLVTLLMANALAFVLVCACYACIYCAVRGGGSGGGSSDATVAKRMALLVFTDFACLAPVAFFGLTALAGRPLVGVPRAKILLVCFYPLNACANPVLYALLTKQYRRDLSALLGKGRLGGGGGVRNPPPIRHQPVTVANHVAPPPPRTPPSEGVAAAPSSTTSSSTQQHRGSPHPLRNSNTRLNISGGQELIVKRALEATLGTTEHPLPVYSDSHF